MAEGNDDRRWYFWTHTRMGFWYSKWKYRTRAEALAERNKFREDGLQATAVYDSRKDED